ncbi:SURF1 family protein [Emcibacter sp. SYSU 3D8]|uniref:SURF1 family protein n=1 Tax=Emcibacter sp. SYSU 3D8 TaxID=3133969 RepID=UPI0031FEC554
MTTLFLQKPRPIPVIFTVVAIIVCTACGVWQLQRMAWKHDKMQLIEERIGLPEVPLPATIEHPEAWEYQHVTLSGTFLHDKESYTPAQSTRGNYGFQVITPLVRPDGSMVMINRGWVPDSQRDPSTRTEGLVQGETTVAGIVRLPWHQKWIARLVMPPADLEQKIFFDGNLAAMAKAQDVTVLPVFVEADGPPTPGGWPKGGQTVIKLSDPHLSYAIQWFAFAITAAVIFVLYHRRKG